MLRQVYIVKSNEFVYDRNFGKSVNKDEFLNIFRRLKDELRTAPGATVGSSIYFNIRISYILDKVLDLYIIFLTDLSDVLDDIKFELKNLKKEFLNLFEDMLDEPLDPSLMEFLNPLVDSVHKNLRPKISVVGFSGVGKTTTTKLIREEEIPMEHVPTITGIKSSIKIGKLLFHLWDFAGQEQFSYLWGNFIKGSDAVLLITDSTLENVEKSKFFVELVKDDAPDAHMAVIGNKQDLSGALTIEKIEEITGIRTYSMVAIDPKNREKMIRIISDILEINPEVSSLLKPLYERDLLIIDAQNAFDRGDDEKALNYFQKISDLCIDLGEDTLGKEYYEKAENLRKKLKTVIAKKPEIKEELKIQESTPREKPLQETKIPKELEIFREQKKITTLTPPDEPELPEEHKMPEISTKLTSEQETKIPEEPKMPEASTEQTSPQEYELPEEFKMPEISTKLTSEQETKIPEEPKMSETSTEPTLSKASENIEEDKIPEASTEPIPPKITETENAPTPQQESEVSEEHKSSDVSSLLLRYERDLLITDAQNAYSRGDFKQALSFYEKISEMCIEIGDDSLGKEFHERAEKIKRELPT